MILALNRLMLTVSFYSLIPSSSLSSSSARATSSLQYSKNIRRPSSLQVDCPTVEEAIRILTKAYRSVSEREIGVGDHVVFYSIQRIQEEMTDGDAKNDTFDLNGPQSTGGTPNVQSPKMIYQSKIWTAPLKKHWTCEWMTIQIIETMLQQPILYGRSNTDSMPTFMFPIWDAFERRATIWLTSEVDGFTFF